ncbi:MAG: helix-turn-helix domain-containing protein [Bacilli bacterium]|nr:helix-turn-helix domain-containing protein [Bacilli bacterium]
MNKLRSLRKALKMTQEEAAEFLSVSRRSYQQYESGSDLPNSLKYQYMVERMSTKERIDEENGILSIDSIKAIVKNVLKGKNVNSCYLFGSYAYGGANRFSDVDLVIDADIHGLEFYGLVEELRESLHKKVDVVAVEELVQNKELISEVLRYGLKII